MQCPNCGCEVEEGEEMPPVQPDPDDQNVMGAQPDQQGAAADPMLKMLLMRMQG